MNVAVVALVLSIAAAPDRTPAGEQERPAGISAASADVWLVSTRHLACGSCPGTGQPEFWRLREDAQWDAADQGAFLAADRRGIPTVFLVHGNRTDACDAVAEGLAFCEDLETLAPKAKFRLVVWSWPADRVTRRHRPDLQIKDVASQHEAVHVAGMLQRIRPEVPVCLVGYSYGSQTIVGAIKLLAGSASQGIRRNVAPCGARP